MLIRLFQASVDEETDMKVTVDEGTDMKVIVVVGGDEVSNVSQVRDLGPMFLSFR